MKKVIAGATLLIFLFASPPEAAQRWERQIAPGINYVHLKKLSPKGTLHLHVLKVDLNQPRLTVRPALARDQIGRLEPTSRIAYRNGALAAVNGSYFEASGRPHLPVGLLIIDKKILTKSLLSRTTLGITYGKGIMFGIPRIFGKVVNLETHQRFDIWGVNRPRKFNEVILYTPEYGPRTRTNRSGTELIVEENRVVGVEEGNAEIPREGYVLSFHGTSRRHTNALPIGADIMVNWGLSGGWERVAYALTGGPRLLKDGKIVAGQYVSRENFRSVTLTPSSRTAVGTVKNDVLYLVVAEKYPRRSRGVTYGELAHLLHGMKVIDAMGLDGGSSATMYVDGRVVNFPQDGTQRWVANALIVKFE